MKAETCRNIIYGKYYQMYFWLSAHFPLFFFLAYSQGEATRTDISILSLPITRSRTEQINTIRRELPSSGLLCSE